MFFILIYRTNLVQRNLSAPWGMKTPRACLKNVLENGKSLLKYTVRCRDLRRNKKVGTKNTNVSKIQVETYNCLPYC